MKIKKLLNAFQPNELLEIRLLLSYGLIGNSKAISELYEVCLKLHQSNPQWKESNLSRALFPNKNPENIKKYVRVRMARLTYFIEVYLGLQALKREAWIRDICKLEELTFRRWELMFSRSFNQAAKRVTSNPFSLQGAPSFPAAIKAKTRDSINKPIFGLTFRDWDRKYMVNWLSLACKALSQDIVRGTDHTEYINIGLNVIDILERSRSSCPDPVVELYKTIFDVIQSSTKDRNTEDDDINYSLARKLLLENWKKILGYDKREVQDLFSYLINYVVRRFNQKEVRFSVDLKQLYLTLIENDLLTVGSKIASHKYKNINSLFLAIKEYDFVSEFQAIYAPKIGGYENESVKEFCYGRLFYELGDFKSARKKLNLALSRLPHHQDVHFEMEIHGLIIRVSYEQGELAEITDWTQTLSHLLSSGKKVDPIKRMSYTNFLIRFSQLLEFRESGSSVTPLKRGLIPCYASKWLDEQLEYLKAQIK